MAHVRNPYRPEADLAAVLDELAELHHRIQRLLGVHTIHLIGGTYIYLVHLREPGKKRVMYYGLRRISD
jgi:hypothetical protein